MSVQAIETPSEVRQQVSETEWRTRVDLAAAYRLVALYGWDDLVFTHISARLPGPEHHFLLNRYGVMHHEMRASDLVKIDRSLGLIQNRTGVEVMRTQQQLNSLAQRVSQQR